jgi:hypothetical protein
MDRNTELLARTTLEDAPLSRSKVRASDASEAEPKQRRTFDHLLLFRAICSTTSGYDLTSQHLSAGLNEVEDATSHELRQWLYSHAENVR